ncbi:MAG: amino acid permease [Gammaproteobacteria bacterium]|nr:amino acid permease [Gammaproteobacteria bacterium]
MHKKLGLWTLTALVAGNMVGAGIFLFPANLASIGSISLYSWGFTALGAFLLAVVFSKMSLLIPKSGGPYAYARAGFGDFIGFQTAYGYWLSIWISNAAIALAATNYMAVFWPILQHPLPNCFVAIAILWVFTIINACGVRAAGVTQLITVILKFIPLLAIAIFGWFYFHPSYIVDSYNVTGQSNFHAVSEGAALTLWAFIGLESATIPVDLVNNPSRNIPLATFLGTLLAALVYILSSTVIMGMIPGVILAKSISPFAAAADMIFGHWGKWIIAIGAIISCVGSLNGWVLLQGQMPMAVADDRLFPKIFAKRSKKGVPVRGLIVTSLLITSFLLFTISPNLVEQFKFIVLIATLVTLLPYFYTSFAEIICLQHEFGFKKAAHILVAILAALYVFWAIVGSGERVFFYGSILIFSGIPLYVLMIRRRK